MAVGCVNACFCPTSIRTVSLLKICTPPQLRAWLFLLLGEECRDPWAAGRATHALLQQQHGQHEGQECQEVSGHVSKHTRTAASACLFPPSVFIHLFLSLLTHSLSPVFPAWLPSIPWVYFCVFLLPSVPLLTLHSASSPSHTHFAVLSWAEDEVLTKLCFVSMFSDSILPRDTFPNWQSVLTFTTKMWTLAQSR